MVHGPLAQAFFALIVAIALITSERMGRPVAALDGATRGLTLAAALLVYLQIVFGALLTHAGRIDLHLIGALAVFALVPVVTARLRRTGDAVMSPAARTLLILLAVQLVLGVGAYLARFSADLDSGWAADHAGVAGRPSPDRRTDPGRQRRPGRAGDGRRRGPRRRPWCRGAPSEWRDEPSRRGRRRRPAPRARTQVAADLISLTKPRVVLMVLITTVVGYYVGLPGAPDYTRLLALLVGTTLAAGGTLALNQYWERDVDALMERTRMRALPEGRLAPLEALLFGAATTAGGLAVLAIGAGWLAALVTAATFVALRVRLHAAQAADLAVHAGRCRARGAAAGHGLGGRPRRHRRSAPGCCSASCSSGSCRTRWPSPGSTRPTTRAPACACCR